MSLGNRIIVSADEKGKHMEGILQGALKPGTVVQRDASVALVGGRASYKVFTRDADGDHPAGAFWVLLEDMLQGKSMTDAYADGDRCFLYSPQPGDELNLLYGNIAGTADDHALGEIGVVDTGTGKIIVTTGSPECEVCQLLEVVTDPTADFLAWVEWSGH